MLSASDSRRFSTWATVLDNGLLKVKTPSVGKVTMAIDNWRAALEWESLPGFVNVTCQIVLNNAANQEVVVTAN
ncbi:hypothetical protein DAPPUDRAFT_242118 [Daphnia pulex]|uniref:Uncharacterized protein n=1 Tax=Daphnia pulex TaxID=6669 RepID=E9GFX4_DAPPU|nr:hypothetical protein DAPPUDRAFT_242118 [Daphnia pulex]|eukprot:EFX81715.1 hypothetical protein DAPPUDRAFT_242118 [Daphnia pulex]